MGFRDVRAGRQLPGRRRRRCRPRPCGGLIMPSCPDPASCGRGRQPEAVDRPRAEFSPSSTFSPVRPPCTAQIAVPAPRQDLVERDRSVLVPVRASAVKLDFSVCGSGVRRSLQHFRPTCTHPLKHASPSNAPAQPRRQPDFVAPLDSGRRGDHWHRSGRAEPQPLD